MKDMVPVESIVVVRAGKRVSPKIGKPFPFTDGEVESIKRTRPEAFRQPINEASGDSQTDVRTAAGRVAEGGRDMTDENLDAEQHEDALDVGGSGSGEAEADEDQGGGAEQSDAEVEEANRVAAEEAAAAKAAKPKAGAAKPAAKPKAKIDDL